MGLFDRSLFRWIPGVSSEGRHAAAARKAELRGELASAAELWDRAGRPADVVRVMLLRGDGEADPARRMPHYTQALAVARSLGDEGRGLVTEATQKRAALVVSLAAGATASGGLSAARRRELREAARELEGIGDAAGAAEAYHLAEDQEGEARALTQAGDVEQLEELLAGEAGKSRLERERKSAHAEIDLLEASGRRREALARAEALAKLQPGDRAARDRAASLAARRVAAPLARVALDGGEAVTLVFGDAVVVGRTEGEIRVPSHAVSRRHVRIARRPDGAIAISDLGSRNGVQLRGLAVHGELVVEGELALTLGNEVRLVVAPSELLPRSASIVVAGQKYVAPLGPARLPAGGLRLEVGADGWIELVSEEASAYLKDVVLVPRATLLVGDRVSLTRGGPVALEIHGS